MRGTIASAIMLLAASSVHATLLSGTGGAQTDAAVAGGTTVGFDTLATGNFVSVTDGAVTVSSTGDPLTVGTDFNGDYNTRGGQSILNGFDEVPDNFRIDFAGGTDAFTFNWGAADVNWLLSAFTSGGILIESYVIAPTFGSNAGDYYGIAASGITYATIVNQSGGDYVFIDDVTYRSGDGTVDGTVPTPATLALLGLGLAGLGYTRRRLN